MIKSVSILLIVLLSTPCVFSAEMVGAMSTGDTSGSGQVWFADNNASILLAQSQSVEEKELQYAVGLMEKGEREGAIRMISNIINNGKDKDAVAGALYYRILWDLVADKTAAYEKLKAYHPSSKYVDLLENIIAEKKTAERAQKAEALKEFGLTGDIIDLVRTWDNRFIAFNNGMVWDTKTDLEWMAGPNRNTPWQEAKTWVDGLAVYGGDWRIPEIKELKSLYIRGIGPRNMTPFIKTTGWFVWSEEKDELSAWFFSFDFGRKESYYRTHAKKMRGFAVRPYSSRRWRDLTKKPSIRTDTRHDISETPSKTQEKQGKLSIGIGVEFE